MTVKQSVHRLLHRFGFDIVNTRFQQRLINFIDAYKIELVLDVGANVGQFASSLRGEGYRGRIMSFEPISQAFAALSAAAANDPAWQTHHFALGDAPGQSTIHVAASTVFSSILNTRDTASRFAEAAVTREETIEVRRLDDVCPAITGNTLLKIDTQGYERHVLDGAPRTLSKVKGVLMELPAVHLYEDTWELHEAMAYMAHAGFVPAQFHPVSYHTDGVSLLEMDCLFRRRDDRGD